MESPQHNKLTGLTDVLPKGVLTPNIFTGGQSAVIKPTQSIGSMINAQLKDLTSQINEFKDKKARIAEDLAKDKSNIIKNLYQ